MHKFICSLALIICAGQLFAQNKLPVNGVKIKEQHLYFVLDDDQQLRFFTKKQSNKQQTGDEKRFDIKGNNCNLYFKWLNPIKYRFVWADTSFTDERDEEINGFISKLADVLGAANLNTDASKDALSKTKPTAGVIAPVAATGIIIPAGGFNDPGLNLLFVLLRANQDQLLTDVNTLSNLAARLKELDTITDVPRKLDTIFTRLFNIADPDSVKIMVFNTKTDIQKFQNDFTKIEATQKDISKMVTDLSLKDPMLNSLTRSSVSKFLGQIQEQTAENKALVGKLAPIVDMVDKSVSDRDDERKDYFRNRSISFEDGKVFQTTLVINEYEYKSADKDFVKKAVVAKTRLIFRKYDPFSPFISAGLFFSNTTLKGFGVATQNDQSVVTEVDINKNMPVTALFLNFNLGVHSRYFAPLAQLGIDPTKKRPFLLFGAGFAIPSARFAISGGPIWTWNQSLDKLKTGDVIGSTTDLEKDIKYKFDVEPKGWYLGVQYNF